MVVAESDPMTGVGRALPHRGFSALQPWRTIKASGSATTGRNKTPIRFIRDRSMRWAKRQRMSADRLKPEDRPYLLPAIPLFRRTFTSTLRFSARPDGVSFVATAWVSPIAAGDTMCRIGTLHCWTK